MKRLAKPKLSLVLAFSVTVLLVALFSFSSGGGVALAGQLKPSPSPTPSRSGGVNSQATGNLNPGDTFCLPVQQVAGIQKGQVEGGGKSYEAPGAPPIATRWTAYNGPTASNLQAINTATNSFVVMVNTVPKGSYYQVCMTNITNVVVAFSIQQSEYTNDPPFP